MPANPNPMFTRVADIQWTAASLATGSTTKDGTTAVLAFTADATNGGYVDRMRFRALGTNVVSMARVWINNGSTSATATNNVLWDEITLPATTISEVAALSVYELPLGFALPPGYRLYVVLATTVAAGYHCSTIGGKY